MVFCGDSLSLFMQDVRTYGPVLVAKKALLICLLHCLGCAPSIASDTKPVPEYADWLKLCMSTALANESSTGQWGSSVDKAYNKSLCNCRFVKLSRKHYMSYEDLGNTYQSCRIEHGMNVAPWMMKYQSLYD